MEVEGCKGEVRYELRIPNFSSYKNFSHSFTSDFPLSMNGLRSLWRLTVTPFLPTNPNISATVHCDVGISLECLKCTLARPDIEIYCCVAGRDQHEKRLDQDGEVWSGTLVPRVALSVFKLLQNEQLNASLRFVLRGGNVWRNEDPLEELSRQLGELHRNESAVDVDVLTIDGVNIPAHSAILLSRSNLLQKSRDWNCRSSHDTSEPTTPKRGIEIPSLGTKMSDTPLSSTFGSCASSGYQSSASPDSTNWDHTAHVPAQLAVTPSKRHLSPSKLVPTSSKSNSTLSKPNSVNSKQHLTPTKHSSTSNHITFKLSTPTSTPPNKPFAPRHATPNTPLPPRNRTSNTGLTPISTLSDKPPTPRTTSHKQASNTPLTPKNILSNKAPTPPSSSHNKRPLTPGRTTPSKRQLTYHMTTPFKQKDRYSESDPLKENEKAPIHSEKASRLSSSASSSSSSTTSSSSSSLPLQDLGIHEARGAERTVIRVNMSASVARQMLEWIYTGWCSDLNRLSRPLLVGGLRHGVWGLARACELHLAAALTPTTTPDTLLLAEKYGAQVLQEAALQYAVAWASEVTEQPTWCSVAARAPALITEFSRRLAAHARVHAHTS